MGSAKEVLSLDLEGVFRGGVQIIGSLALRAHTGETVAIVGPSGIGKTTLLRVAAGLLSDYRGTCQASENRAFVFQEPRLLPWRSLAQNLTIATGISHAGAEAFLGRVGLDGKSGSLPSEISLGQQRRVALARAFATDPDLLLMDEPFASLDTRTADAMMALFAEFRAERDMATLMVTHSMGEAEKLATRIVTLEGEPAGITSDAQNAGAYFQLSASGVTSSGS